MSKALLTALATFATLIAPADAGTAGGHWVQLVPAGKFTARDGRGPYDAGDRAMMQAIVDASRQYAGTAELAIDYDHQSVFGAIDGVGGTARAAGWIKEMQVRDDGIFGRVLWTDAAAAAIRAMEYRYISPVFRHDKQGRVRLIQMASLTNTPALDMMAVAASQRFNDNQETDMDKILAALGLAKGSGEDAILSAITTMQTSATALAKAAGLGDDAKAADVLTAVASAFTDRKKLAEASGLAADAKTDDLVVVMSAGKAGKPDPAKFVPIEQVSALQADVKAMKDKIANDAAETAVASAIEAGKLAPSMKEWGLTLAKESLAKFEAFAAGAPSLTASQMRQAKIEETDLDAENPVALSAAATVYQKKCADAGQPIDFATAVMAVKEGKK